MNNDIDVSIVIVCMNNLKNLYPCLESIRKYTNKVSYETMVVAYLFSRENLIKVKNDFPWVTFIESNEIRGFSENNNLALRQANGKYCFVLNDDTEMRMPVVDKLYMTIKDLSQDVAIISPTLVAPNGSILVCGRPYMDWRTCICEDLHIKHKGDIEKYCNKNGIFQSYNIIGAAFLIKTEIFKSVGWFDEKYFFCPEDIALSDLLNKMGYKCYVCSDTKIIHYEGMSGKSLSLTQTATRPAQVKGMILFYSEGKKWLMILLTIWNFIHSLLQFLFHRLNSFSKPRPNEDYVLSIGDLNVLKIVFSKKTPKEIFVKFYKGL